MIFWNSELNEVDARLLYENSVPLIKTENKVQLKGKDEGDASDEEKLNTSFTITPGFFLGYFGSMGLNSSYDLQISFKITIKNLHSKWRNILLMSNNNMFAGGKKATHFWGPRNGGYMGPGCSNYSRCPGIWVWPNRSAIHIMRSTSVNWNEGLSLFDIPFNEEVSVNIILN